MQHYIKLTGAKTGHLYHVERYDLTGIKLENDMIDLKDLDKKCPKLVKLRINGAVWGRVTSEGNILPLDLPKFLRYSA